MRPRDAEVGQALKAKLQSFSNDTHSLPGIHNQASCDTFVDQLLESIRRVKFVAVERARELSYLRADPASEMFDPVRAAIIQHRRGNTEDAFWLLFLFAHFGKHLRAGYRYAREIYGRLGEGGRWDWSTTSVDVAGFRSWLDRYQDEIKRDDGPHGFGNHRKYESLDGFSPTGTGAIVESYIGWIAPPRTHQEVYSEFCTQASGDPCRAFGALFDSMSAVIRFGRTARLDYLAMVGKVGLANIEPDSAHLRGSTGPRRGAELLFGSDTTIAELEALAVELGCRLGVGMQVIEDALCNWQKSPGKFVPFRG